jgi:hypothetical protein
MCTPEPSLGERNGDPTAWLGQLAVDEVTDDRGYRGFKGRIVSGLAPSLTNSEIPLEVLKLVQHVLNNRRRC